MIHHFITGVAGFIGSHLAEQLIADGHRVSGMDDFSLGRMENIAAVHGHGRFFIVRGDAADSTKVTRVLQDATEWGAKPDMVWHLASNSDIAAGVADTTVDFRKTLQTTFAALQASKAAGVRRFALASTSAVYGERQNAMTEDSGPLLPISNYGAAKLASEALVSAAAETSLDRAWVFRFPNVVGSRMTHGALYDFRGRLRQGSETLSVLGDGTQTKPYLHVSEVVDAMKWIVAKADGRRNVFNIGPKGSGTKVSFLAEQTVAKLSPGTAIAYAGGDRGWVGDVPRFEYSTAKLAALGWKPKMSSDEAVLRAIDELAGE
ncbi:MAG: NAD-dependent epimerase/dehydratase family protein [Bryobacteraceae bacterium]